MGKKSAASKTAASDRQAKIDAAAKATKVGPNKILIGTVVALVAIIAVVAGVIIADQANKSDTTVEAQLPVGVSAMGEGFRANPDVTLNEGAPSLVIYEDFRCPACHQAYAVFHNTVSDLAANGEIELTYSFKTVIDSNSGGTESLKAASSAMCAAGVGSFTEYHETILDGIVAAGGQQPIWGADFFTRSAEAAGITGADLTAFNECVADGRYDEYIRSVDEEAARNGINSTPQYHLNGEMMDFNTVNTPDLFREAVANATGE